MKRILFLFPLLFPLSLFSQTGPSQAPSIQGEVKSPDGRSAGIGLYVVLESDASGGFITTQTDSRGKFSFTSLAKARYRVRVRAPGYEEESEEIDLSTTPVAYMRLTLRAKPTENAPQPITGFAPANLQLPDDMPDDARKEFQEGFNIFTSGKNQQKCISHFKKSAKKYPQYAPTYYYLGVAHAIDKNLDDAVPALRKSIELNEKSPEALTALGAIYNSQKQYADAESLLMRAITLAPESFDAHKELAKALMPDLQRTPEAEQHLKKALSINRESVEAHILLGNVLLRQRNAEAALQEYHQALRLDPKGSMAEPTRQTIEKIETALKASK